VAVDDRDVRENDEADTTGTAHPEVRPSRRSIVNVTGILTAIVVGLIIGALARLVLPGKQNIPIWLTILVGALGAILGTLVAQYLGVAVTPGIDWIEIVLQIAIAAVGVTIAANVYNRRRKVGR
jgi:uncharacterized membrane protein YeaQ/YmgE (transglycosylase-associated protein family)